MKKRISLFLILLLLNLQWGNIPVYGAANSEGDFITTLDSVSGGVIINGYTGTSKVVNIPETIGGKSVTSIGDFAFAYNQLASVTIPTSVTSIGDSAFYSNRLASVTIPASVTSIGATAFAENQLASVTIPTSVTSIGTSAFYRNQLASVTIPTSVTSIGDSVFTYNQLASVTIPTSVTSIGDSAFAYNQLTSVTIPTSVTSIGDSAFYRNQLASVTIPTSMTSIGDSAFYRNQLNQVEFKGQISNLSQTVFNNQTKPGAIFHGWFKDLSYTNPWTGTVAEPMTIYAKWNTYSTGIVLSPKTSQLTVGGTQNFQLVENLSDGTTQDQTANTVFTVSDPSIAMIQGSTLTAIAPGTVTVTATYGSTIDTATITVNAVPVTTTGIVLSPKTSQLTVGGTQNFQLVENLSDGTTQDQTANTVFTVSDPSIAMIQGSTLTAIAPGTVTVTATYGSTIDTATITVNAVPVTTTGIVLSPKTSQLTVGDTENFRLVENLSDGTTQDQTANTVFTVSDPSIAMIQGSTLTAIAPGTVTVTATYGSTTDTATITVNAAPVTTTGIVLSPKTSQLTVGDTENFRLVENLSDGTTQDQTANTVFTVSDPSIAMIQGSTLTAIAPGTVTVTATYGSTTDTATITVNAAPVTTTGIVLSPKTSQLTVGDTENFRLVENLSDGTTQDQTANTVFTVSDPSIAMIQGSTLTAIAPGTVTVTATYGSTTDTATIMVNATTVPKPTPVPEPDHSVEPMPSRVIHIIRMVEQGIVKYRADVLLDHVQAFVPQRSNQDARTIRLVYPAETATAEAHLSLSRNAGLFLNKQQTNFFMQTALAQLTMPSTSFGGVTEDVFFRIVPVKAQQQEVIQTNALKNEQIQQAMPKRAIISLMGTPVTIETNLQNRPVTITLPISAELTEEQKASLVVYIEHSDATTEVKRGRIVEFEPGVKGFQFEVDHFSTFSLLYASEVQEEEEKVEVEVKRLAPYIQGYPDGTFKPNAPVTRAQMATMLARFLTNGDIPTTTNSSFEDTINHPSKDEIEVVKQAGLFNGITETTFNPNGTITRAQMARVVAHWNETVCAQEPSKTNCHATGKGKSFTDVSPTHWASSAIEQASARGIMMGNSETTFNPNGSLTRAQAVKVLNQLFERPTLEDVPTSTFSDVPSTHWAIGEIEAAATERMAKK